MRTFENVGKSYEDLLGPLVPRVVRGGVKVSSAMLPGRESLRMASMYARRMLDLQRKVPLLERLPGDPLKGA